MPTYPSPRALLDKFGYRDRNGDGFREAPDGRPLVLRFASEPDQTSRQYDELWQRSLAAIGLRTEFQKQKWPEQFKAAREGRRLFFEALVKSVRRNFIQRRASGRHGERIAGKRARLHREYGMCLRNEGDHTGVAGDCQRQHGMRARWWNRIDVASKEHIDKSIRHLAQLRSQV